ncbi:MAG: hypothetical protein Q4C50_02155 [Eubacteriales bacterium]|nr:hypothetical protein [Eubacteriales bacterium]
MRWFMKAIPLVYLAWAAGRDIRQRTVSVRGAIIFAAAGVLLHMILNDAPADWMPGILPGGALIAVGFMTRGAVGYGDGMAMAVTGLYLGGFGAVSVLGTGLMLTFPVSLWMIAVKKAGRKESLPFLPFLLAGYMVWLILTP